MNALLAIIVVVALVAVVYRSIENALAKLRDACDEAWPPVEAALEQRRDLVPDLVEVLRARAGEDDLTVGALTDACAATTKADGVQALAATERELSRCIDAADRLAAEHPDLRAGDEFQALRQRFARADEAILDAQQAYNARAEAYALRGRYYPSRFVAGGPAFPAKPRFELEPRRPALF